MDRRTALEHPRGSSSPDRNPIHLAYPTRWPAVGVGLAAFLVGVAVAWASAAPAAEVPSVAWPGLPQATPADGLPYRIDAFELSYAQDNPENPPIAEIMNLEIELGEVADGYVAPREDLPLLRIRLADVPLAGPEIYYGSAIRTIDRRIGEEFARRGLAGFLVHPDEDDIDLGTARDLRPPGRTAMGVVIRAPVPEPLFGVAPDVPTPALPGQPWGTHADGLRYLIDAFELSYAQDHPEHPPIAEIMDLEIELGEVADGYVAPREDLPLFPIRLADVPLFGAEIYYGSAISTIGERIGEEFARRGLADFLVLPDKDDVDLGSNRDLRPPWRTAMGVVISHRGVEATTGDGPTAVPPPVALPGHPEHDVDVSMCSSNPQLPALPFEFDRAEITPQGAAVLDSLVDHLNLCENARINIDGHTDQIGTESYNRDLSERRARAAQRYLSEAGIDSGRLLPRGFGEADPLASNTTREGRALNRRVELR